MSKNLLSGAPFEDVCYIKSGGFDYDKGTENQP